MAGFGETVSNIASAIGDTFSSANKKFMAGDKSAPLIKTIGAMAGAFMFFQLSGGWSQGGSALATAALGGLFGIYAGTVINEPIQNMIAQFKGEGGNSRDVARAETPELERETTRTASLNLDFDSLSGLEGADVPKAPAGPESTPPLSDATDALGNESHVRG